MSNIHFAPAHSELRQFLRCGVTFTIPLAGLWMSACFAQKNAMGRCGIFRGESSGAVRNEARRRALMCAENVGEALL
jgi:hypothetical protein